MNYEIFAMPFDHVINTVHKKIFMNSPTSFPMPLTSFRQTLKCKEKKKIKSKEAEKEGGKVNAMHNTRD